MRDFAAIDFETANEQPSSVCSVGVVIVRDGEIVDSFYSLIHPEPEYYQWFCQQVHGLGRRTPKMHRYSHTSGRRLNLSSRASPSLRTTPVSTKDVSRQSSRYIGWTIPTTSSTTPWRLPGNISAAGSRTISSRPSPQPADMTS